MNCTDPVRDRLVDVTDQTVVTSNGPGIKGERSESTGARRGVLDTQLGGHRVSVGGAEVLDHGRKGRRS